MRHIRAFIHDTSRGSGSARLPSYVFTPFTSQLVNFPEHSLFDVTFKHLEYFPIVNQRVFPIGGQEAESEHKSGSREILNVQLKGTYQKFIYMLCH